MSHNFEFDLTFVVVACRADFVKFALMCGVMRGSKGLSLIFMLVVVMLWFVGLLQLIRLASVGVVDCFKYSKVFLL